jgi:hypothetical protein
MKVVQRNRSVAMMLGAAAAIVLIVACSNGCARWRGRYMVTQPLPLPNPPAPLGSTVDPYFQLQEQGGEARDFIIYEHEFEEDTARLTADGEDHMRQIAARVAQSHFPVIVQQSKIAAKRGTKYEYPVHPNPELDSQRLQVVVRGLSMMGVANAAQRAVVAPALSPGYTSTEGERAYNEGIWSSGYGGFGGGAGGFGGFGGFGGGFGGF